MGRDDFHENILLDSNTIVEILMKRAVIDGDETAMVYLEHGEINNSEHISFQELDRRARAAACQFLKDAKKGDRAILLFDSSMDFFIAFFGCLYAGIIAIPVAIPGKHYLYKFEAIVNDCHPALIISKTKIIKRVMEMLERNSSPVHGKWVDYESLLTDMSDGSILPVIESGDIAFIQYTSGSTSLPKGVMVSHSNLINNEKSIRAAMQITKASKAVISWLPYYHDMGLIGSLLQPVYSGIAAVAMSPYSFMQKPLRWLQAISYFKGALSGAPNFAFDLCVNKVGNDDLKSLDLSEWKVAFLGSEPVRLQTMKNFYEKFRYCGFKEEFLYPCYGLAESTLMVSGVSVSGVPKVIHIDSRELNQNRITLCGEDEPNAMPLVSCGKCVIDHKLLIIQPEGTTIVKEMEIGEICISGPSIMQGYWQKEKETQETLLKNIPGCDNEIYLRTGDLGFIYKGELYITGRIKDLIIIRGANYYPQDIEQQVEKCHPALSAAGSAAFTVEQDGREKLVIVQEIERAHLHRLEPEKVLLAIRRAVLEHFSLEIYAIILIKPCALPKTTSGKVQRQTCKQLFLNNELPQVAEWRRTDASKEYNESAWAVETLNEPVLVRDWLKKRIAYHLGVSQKQIKVNQPLAVYGMDSLKASILSGELEELLGRKIPPTVFYDNPSIIEITDFLLLGGESRKLQNLDISGENTLNEPVAVVGMACRFPGARDIKEFWSILENGVDAIRPVPKNRWPTEKFYNPDNSNPGTMITRHGGFIEEVDLFDADLFDISPREAQKMDPQQRILLEVVFQALENANLSRTRLSGTKTGVFVGISNNDYSRSLFGDLNELDIYSSTGNAFSIAANRISYVFNLHGPSIVMDTACSSSLAAVHLACQSLITGESSMAIAGGVNLILSPHLNIAFSKAKMMSPDEKCKTFDANANGYVRGEGCGVVVLKPLSKALRDKDHIWAVIKGSALNQNGRSNGLTAPNIEAQKEVISEGLKAAGVIPAEVSMIETHGTGTQLGDPIEFNAIRQIYSEGRDNDSTCWLGAVKTNIGHLESAAGIAGLIKVVLAIKNGKIPPNLNFSKINPLIEMEDTPFKIPQELSDWKTEGDKRFAGVSSFGFGGTNVHVIVEEAPQEEEMTENVSRPYNLLAVSAKNEVALKNRCSQYLDFLREKDGVRIGDLSYTANISRSDGSWRAAFIADSAAIMIKKLESYVQNGRSDFLFENRHMAIEEDKITFLFTGQGSQYYQMGRQLYETQPYFRRELDKCSEILKPWLGEDLIRVLYGSRDEELINWTYFSQPALFSLEYALAKLWMSWGVKPGALLGHSVGEYVAACIADVFTLEEGLKLIAERSRLMGSVTDEGLMAVVFKDADFVEPFLDRYKETVSVASYNSPSNTVISGKNQDVLEILNEMKKLSVSFTTLRVSNAFHSPLISGILEKFRTAANNIVYKEPKIPILSNVTGDFERELICSADYWCRHIMAPVLFEKSIRALSQKGFNTFIEMGAKPELCGLGMECLSGSSGLWLPSLNPQKEDWIQLMTSVAQLYTKGYTFDWECFENGYNRNKIVLPTYPFAQESYWISQTNGEMQKYAAAWTGEQTVLDRLKKGDLTGALEDIRNTLLIEEHQEEEFQKLLAELLRVYRKQTGQNCSDSEYKLSWEKESNLDLRLPRTCVSGLPTIKPLIEESLEKNKGTFPLNDFGILISEMEAVCLHYILNAFCELGWNLEKTGLFNPREIMGTCGVIPKYNRLFYRLLRICREDGVFSNEGDLWRVGQIPMMGIGLEEWKKRFQEKHVQFVEELELFHRCAINLSGVLTGKNNEIDLLFPGGDDTQIGKLYLGSPISKILNTTAGNIIGFFSKGISSNCKLRILEIGAGTGSTSSYLFPELPAENVIYTYTDISPLFIQLGKVKFKEYPFIIYKCLDIGKTAVDQGFERAGYDIIVASNVLHATPDLRASISNARELLAPKGVMLLIEGTYEERWIDLIFGLTEGWWCFKDTDIRPEYPLVSGGMWIDLLKEAGFENVLDLWLPGSDKSFLTHQHIIVGQLPHKSVAGMGKTTVDWLVFGDRARACGKLIEKIREEGENVILVVPSEDLCPEESEVPVYPAGAEHFGRILEDIQDKLEHILYFWPVRKGEADGLGDECEGLRVLVKEIVKKQWHKSLQVNIVTQTEELKVLDVDITSMLDKEFQGVNIKWISIDETASEGAASLLYSEIKSGSSGKQVAFLRGDRLVYRQKSCRPEKEKLGANKLEVASDADLLEKLKASEREERMNLLDDFVCRKLSKILRLKSYRDIDHHKGFFELGMDSLMAVEFKNQLQSTLQIKIPVSVTFDYPTLKDMIYFLDEKISGQKEDVENMGRQNEVSVAEDSIESIEDMSEDELAMILFEKINGK